jgi:Glycosyltransferase
VTPGNGSVDVVVVGSSPWPAELPDDDINLRTARALAERLGGRYDVIVPAGAARPGRVDRDPVQVHRVEMRSRPGFLLSVRRALRELGGNGGHAPVLVSSDPLAALAVEVSRSRRGRPHLVHIQGEVLAPGPEYGPRPKRWALATASRFVVRRASGVRVVSRSLRDAVAEVATGPVTFIGSRVDTRRFTPAGPGAPPAADRVDAIMVGGLSVRKNHRTVVHAWARVVRDLPDARLAIVGEGPVRCRLEPLIACLGLKEHVKLYGRLGHGEILPLLRASRCLVHAAWSEGQPRAVLEGMACGLPVVCSDIPPHREIVPDDAGRFVPPGDIRAWAEAIGSVLAHPDRAAAMGRAARAFVVRHHDFEANLDRMADLLRQLAGARPSRGAAP